MGLRNKLALQELQKVLDVISKLGKKAVVGAYLEVITRANIETLREVLKMSKIHPSVRDVFIEVGLVDEWIAVGKAIGEATAKEYEARGKAIGEAIGEAAGEARGKEREALAIAQNMVNLGFPLETVVSATMLDPEKVKTMYQDN